MLTLENGCIISEGVNTRFKSIFDIYCDFCLLKFSIYIGLYPDDQGINKIKFHVFDRFRYVYQHDNRIISLEPCPVFCFDCKKEILSLDFVTTMFAIYRLSGTKGLYNLFNINEK